MPINGFKIYFFVLCPKQGNKIDGIVLSCGLVFWEFFVVSKQGQGLKPSDPSQILIDPPHPLDDKNIKVV